MGDYMKETLQKKLYKKYPVLFSQRKLPMTQTCLCWGLETGNGWYKILDKLCSKLVKIDPKLQATQVKEKFGTLRFYTTGSAVLDMVDKEIESAEMESSKTCETCGNPGRLNHKGWIHCFCKKCKIKHDRGHV
jgi:hypothetical protein